MKKTGIARCARIVVLCLTTVCATSAALATPHQAVHQYFPLHVGDRWVYMQTGIHSINGPLRDPYPMQEIRVTGTVWNSGDTIFRVDNYGFGLTTAEIAFANVGDGGTVEYSQQQSGTWYPWDDAGSRVKFPDFAADCLHGTGGVQLELASVSVPIGDYDDALTIVYDSQPCAQRGLLSETFAPGIGLVERRLLTRSGFETWSLKYAVVNGIEYSGGAIFGPGNGGPEEPATMPVSASTWGAIKAGFSE